MPYPPESSALTIIQWLVLIFVLLLLVFVVEAVRRSRLKERYALLWLGAAGGILVLTAWRSLLDRLALFLGVLYGPSLLFLVALLFLLVILLHFSLVISEHRDKTRRLTQQLALLTYEVERLRTSLMCEVRNSNE
jgi:hypothetical protein